MNIKPYLDWLVAQLIYAIVLFTGFFIMFVVAGEPQFSSHWWMTVAWVGFAYCIIVWLVQLAWSRWKTSLLKRPKNSN